MTNPRHSQRALEAIRAMQPARELKVIDRASGAIGESGHMVPEAAQNIVARDIYSFYMGGNLSVGNNVERELVIPQACRVLRYSATVKTASTPQPIGLRITKNNVSEQTISISAGSFGNAFAPTSYKAFAAGDVIRLDITQVGTTPGTGLTVIITVLPIITG